MRRLIPLLIGLCVLVVAGTAWAQEAWCTANSANCVCSDTLQSTSYTRGTFGSNYAIVLGDQVGSKPCHFDDPASENSSVQWSGAPAGFNTFAQMLQISTDSTVLNLLPNRSPTSVARFLRFAADNDNGTTRLGYAPIDLAGLSSKRIAMRWYSYHTSNYQWQGDGTCTNGKIAHNSAGFQQPALMTLTIHQGGSGATSLYTFIDGIWLWAWSGHSGFEGFTSGTGPRSGAGQGAHNYRGKWYRHEVVVVNPRSTDTGGYNFTYFVKNITDNTAEVEDVRFSAGCTSCMASGGPNFTWDSSIHPTNNMTSLHTEFYRADGCNGWQGWVYAAVASWTTDAGQRIGAASEVEGGSAAPAAPSGLTVTP